MMTFLNWYSNNWILGLIFLLFVAHILVNLMHHTFKTLSVLIRGWPSCPHMSECFMGEEEEEDDDDESEGE